MNEIRGRSQLAAAIRPQMVLESCSTAVGRLSCSCSTSHGVSRDAASRIRSTTATLLPDWVAAAMSDDSSTPAGYGTNLAPVASTRVRNSSAAQNRTPMPRRTRSSTTGRTGLT